MNRPEPGPSIWTDRAVTRWDVFTAGYLAGITDGIGMGRAQHAQETADAETFPNRTPAHPSHASTMFAATGLSRAELHARLAVERNASRARPAPRALTGEQIRHNAFRSWGLRPPHRDAVA